MEPQRNRIETEGIKCQGMTMFFAAGIPAPKGSTKSFLPRNARARFLSGQHVKPITLADNREKQKSFASSVSWSAVQAGLKPAGGPVAIHLQFIMPRPKSLPKRVAHCVKKPDVDKLCRLILDAMTGVAYNDDSQVVQLNSIKRYARNGELTGCEITVYQSPTLPGVVEWSGAANQQFSHGRATAHDGRTA